MIRVIIFTLTVAISASTSFSKPNRVIGGDYALIEDFPYQVSVRHYDSHVCGGVIINEDTILTAAHCVYRIADDDIEVRLGNRIHFLGDYYTVTKTILHDRFNLANWDNDVALLKLERCVEFKEEVQPIGIAPEYDLAGLKATLSGWGKLKSSNGPMANFLQKTYVQIKSDEECKRSHGKFFITNNKFCAGSYERNACQGDEGGPLVINGELIGIVSFSTGCTKLQYSSVYVKISKYYSWIVLNS